MEVCSYQPSTLSQISHELRIPLTGIMGMIHFLNGTTLTPKQKEYLEIIQASAQRLLALEDTLHTFLEENNQIRHLRNIPSGR